MDLNNSQIAVTGATGFLGRYIVNNLLNRGAKVVGVVRNPDRVPELKVKGVELRKADLADAVALSQGFDGCDAVVANAALFSPMNTQWQAHQDANIDGLRNTFDAMTQSDIKRIIHISSMAVYAGGPENIITESRRQHNKQSKKRPWTVYSISKALSEQLAWQLAEEKNISMTALRPCAIYGANDENFTQFFKKIWGGKVGLNIKGPTLRLVYGADVAEGVSLALENDRSIAKSYNLAGDNRIELSELRRLWQQSGGPIANINLPVFLPSSPGTPVSIEAAKQDLGWKNTAILDGLKESFQLERAS